MTIAKKSTLLITAIAALATNACSISTNAGRGEVTGASCSIEENGQTATIECDGASVTIPLDDGCTISTAEGVSELQCADGTSAEVSNGHDGQSTLVETEIEGPGERCAEGGVRIVSGVDANEDGSLSTEEISVTQHVCNGEPGSTSAPLVSNLSPEMPGNNCAAGGVRVDVGSDTDGDGELGAAEVSSTAYVCHGENVTAANLSLTALEVEAPGELCAAGGVRVEVGPDLDTDGVLDPDEVSTAQSVCNGLEGASGADGNAMLTNIVSEPVGENCAAGGIRIDSGGDQNSDQILDAAEVLTTDFVCNGSTAIANGTTPAVTVTAPDPNVSVNASAPLSVTVLEASISVPSSGSIMVTGSADAYCAYPALNLGYDCAATGATSGFLTVSDDPEAPAQSGNFSFFSLGANRTHSVSRGATFTVAEAGTYTFYLRGGAQSGQVGFWRGALTLLFVPHGV